MGMASRLLVLFPACLHLVAASAGRSAAEDDILWPQHPIHIDRSKQTYERLPPVQSAVDQRVWVKVPERIKVLDSARFTFDGKIYRIGNIHPVQPKRICRDREAGRWPCGRLASILLGNLVRGNRLLCTISPGAAETILTHCQSRNRDIASEIIVQGFGRVDGDDAALRSTEELARTQRSGLWRNADCLGDFDHC